MYCEKPVIKKKLVTLFIYFLKEDGKLFLLYFTFLCGPSACAKNY